MHHNKLLTVLALLGLFALDPRSPSAAVASAAKNPRFTDYSDAASTRQAPDDARAGSDPSAWIRSGSGQDLTSRRHGSSLLPGFPAAGSGADPFSTWNQYMYEMVRNLIPEAAMDTSPWLGGLLDEEGVGQGPSAGRKSTMMRLPPGVHARETESERLFFMDLPGLHRSEVTVEVVAGHLLSVRAERKCDPSDAYCTSRTIKHKLELDPDTIDTQKISVNLDAGELRIHLPKRSATRFSIPVVDSLFGLNQPGSSDKAGDKVKIAKVNTDQPEARRGAIHWPGTADAPGIVGAVKDWYEAAKDTAGNVVESAESVAQRAKHGAFGSERPAVPEGGRAAQEAREYGRHAVHHTTDTARNALGHAAHQARDSAQHAANVARQARDRAFGSAQDAAYRVGDVDHDEGSQVCGSAHGVVNKARGAVENAHDTVYGKAHDAAHLAYNVYGSAADSLSQAADTASDTNARTAQAAQETAANAYQLAERASAVLAGNVQAKAESAMDTAKESAENIKLVVQRNLVEPLESATGAAARKAGEAVDATRHRADEVVGEAKHKAGSWFGFFQDAGAGAKEAAVEGAEGVKEGWERGTSEARIKRQAGH